MLSGAVQRQVEPAAAALDQAPLDPARIEEGRRDAEERARALRDTLADLGGAASQEGLMRAYETARSLLGDLWDVAVGDAAEAAPQVRAWLKGAVGRAVAQTRHRHRHRCQTEKR